MTMLVLDSGAVSMLAERSKQALALIRAFRREGLWPPLVPSPVLVECLTGDGRRDAPTNQFLKACDVREELPVETARRAARLRTKARRGSVIDALVVATVEPGWTVLTTDSDDITALASWTTGVNVEAI